MVTTIITQFPCPSAVGHAPARASLPPAANAPAVSSPESSDDDDSEDDDSEDDDSEDDDSDDDEDSDYVDADSDTSSIDSSNYVDELIDRAELKLLDLPLGFWERIDLEPVHALAQNHLLMSSYVPTAANQSTQTTGSTAMHPTSKPRKTPATAAEPA